MWKKPKGKYPKDWDKIKSLVMDNAHYRCEICGKIPDNFKEDYFHGAAYSITTQSFRVHHKNLNKSDNRLSNLIYVCNMCHGELHKELNRLIEIY